MANARRIYKYELVPRQDLIGYHPEIHVDIPRGAALLHIDAHGDRMFLWALVDPEVAPARYSILCLPTGSELVFPLSEIPHVGTVLMRGGELVWHFFSDWQPRP